MSQAAAEHRAEGPDQVRCAVITVSDTRTPENDSGGRLIAERLVAAGHQVVCREIVPDEPDRMRAVIDRVRQQSDAILLTGGTGISRRDRTFETVSGLLTKTLPGYGELLRSLSFQEVGAAAMLSRAIGGLLGETVILTMPGSPAAVRLAMDGLILPELSHLVREATK